MKITGSTILGGHPKAIAIVEVLNKLGWEWSISDYDPSDERTGVAVDIHWPGGGATYGGAKSVDEAFEKLARWTAEMISPRLSGIASAAGRLLDHPGQYGWAELISVSQREPGSVPEWPSARAKLRALIDDMGYSFHDSFKNSVTADTIADLLEGKS